MARRLAPAAAGFDWLVPVPPTAASLRWRGFDHTCLLAQEVGRLVEVPVASALAHTGSGRQVGLDRAQRLESAASAFVATSPISGKVLLIDDVITTGATMAACAQALVRAGADEVWGAAIARH